MNFYKGDLVDCVDFYKGSFCDNVDFYKGRSSICKL